MKKSILYRLFRLGAIPVKVRPILEAEGIVVADEGMGGWFITRNVKGPGKRYLHRSEGFSGCLVITKKRIICYTFWKRQINIAVDDPKLSQMYVAVPGKNRLCLSFESSVFREGWQGEIEYRFRTEKAQRFQDLLLALGVRQRTPEEAEATNVNTHFDKEKKCG